VQKLAALGAGDMRSRFFGFAPFFELPDLQEPLKTLELQ